jgi:hypothetical protein
MLGSTGATVIVDNVAGVTVRLAAPEMPLVAALAVMFVVPTVRACAWPFVPNELLMPATAGADEVQVAVLVMLLEVPSVKVAVAVKGCVLPTLTLGAAGVTLMEVMVAAVTVNGTGVDATPKRVAEMLVEPTAVAVASPLEPAALLMLAILGLDDDHVTCACAVMSRVELSL